MPARRDLRPEEIISLLPHIVLIDVSHHPLDFRYRLIGTEVERHLCESRTGQWLSELAHQARGSKIWATLEYVVTERRPLSSDIPYVGPHRDYKGAEDTVMPLSDDDWMVNMLLVSVVYVPKDSNAANRRRAAIQQPSSR